MENEIMNGVEVVETEVMTEKGTNGNFVVPMLIGSVLTGAGIALFKLGQRAVAKYKEKKAQNSAEMEDCDREG